MTLRIQRDTPALLTVTFYVDGTPTNDAPVTVGITKADGSVLVAPGAATANPSPGVYAYSLARQAALNHLTVTWTGANQTQTTVVEIVGGFYITESELRSRANMADAATFSDAKFLAARQWFEDTFERATGVAWVPRFRRVRIAGNGSGLLLPDLFPRSLLSVRAYTSATVFTSYTAAELADIDLADSGAATRLHPGSWPYGARNLVMEYEHGADSPPSDVVEAAAVAIRDRLLSKVTGNKVYAVQTSDGIVRSSTPGDRRPFGIPECDAVANARDHTIPAVA